jgi:hypothetical protein
MNDGTKVKVPAACLLRGTFGEPSGYIQYPARRLNSQYYLQRSTRFIHNVSTLVARAGEASTPDSTDRPCRHGDTPPDPQGPRPARRDEPGCGLRSTPEKRRTRDGHPGLFRGQLVRRPMTSVVRAFAPVNSSALTARHRVGSRETGRG